jgi:glycosidase
MKKISNYYRIAVLLAVMPLLLHAQEPVGLKINPTNWYVGMKSPNVQLLVYGDKVGNGRVKLKEYEGVKITRISTVENPNYVFIDLVISPNAKAGNLHFDINHDGKTTSFDYELANRTAKPQTVTPADFIYLLMPDRFSNGDSTNDKFADMADPTHDRNNPWKRHGGDLQGITNHLNYFTELGVTALWLNPVVENNQPLTDEGGQMRSAYHGYGFTDHYNVDKRLGGNEAYKKLIDEAHKKGIKVIQDAVYNHVGKNHWILKDMPSKDWLNQWDTYTNTSYKDQPLLDPYASKYDVTQTMEGWFVPFLPDLNHKNPLVANYLIQHALWTVEYFGIDAWRIDTYFYNDFEFMNRCNAALLNEYPDMLIFGESWVNSVPNQAYFTLNNMNVPFSCNLPSTVDFQLYFAFNAALNENPGWNDGVQKLYQVLGQDYLYQKPQNLVTFLDNHDLDRYLSVIGEDIDKYKMGMGWLMTLRGIPSMYYGTEILMKNFKNPSDAEVRKDFPGGWEEDKVNKFSTNGRTTKENAAFDFVKKLGAFRKNSSAIGSGQFTQFLPFDDGMYVYFRHDKSQRIMVISNTGKEAKKLDIKRFAEVLHDSAQGKDIFSDKILNLDGLEVKPKQQYILEIQ